MPNEVGCFSVGFIKSTLKLLVFGPDSSIGQVPIIYWPIPIDDVWHIQGYEVLHYRIGGQRYWIRFYFFAV